MNYQDTIHFLFNQFPAFQKNGSAAFKPGLDRVLKLSELADNPHKKIKTIHIAGTNGKGSCSHMLASILQEAGFKVGLFTSPHLKSFTERIKINGGEIPEKRVVSFVNKFKKNAIDIKPSFFEYTTIMAFDYFANEQVDIAVIETGLGGRLDCSNIISPELSIITNIGLDHQEFLGDTLEKIAKEKAGIIKPYTPVIIGKRQSEAYPVFTKIASSKNAPIILAEHAEFNFQLDLKGKYQFENGKTVLSAVKTLKDKGWNVSTRSIENGFKNVVKNTGLMGRWQKLNENPTVICDTGHNEDGVKMIVNQLSEMKFNALHVVWGMVNDKDFNAILKLLPKQAQYYWCSPNNPRALSSETLKQNAAKHNLTGKNFNSVINAYETALNAANSNDLVFVGGSTFVVAEIV